MKNPNNMPGVTCKYVNNNKKRKETHYKIRKANGVKTIQQDCDHTC